MSWLRFGDFNEILFHFEKWGGRDRPEKQLKEFQEVLNDCELRDLGFKGNPFTWCNNREGDQRVLEWLDRFLTNFLWCSVFPNGGVNHSFAAYSDHYLVVLDTEKFVHRGKSFKPFRFEAI